MRSLANTNWFLLELLGFSANLGPIDFSEINKGEMLFRFIPDEGHKNRSGFIHGGVIMTFADIAAAKILRTTDPTFKYTIVQTGYQCCYPIE
ncbi:PaaI family thioesterase [Ochrobactrum pecoris]|uniref:Acyl-coenzyme A thioesterase PaaI-like protein n=1 Tax=Brucella pecoris TaxID=867683 RepID=A0A5C5CCJ5_9HYPH|nr:PaaI family thioesterase [Brucella pecoris]MBB4095994.1 acyl-coenzyme A thioesterase PaaI-like protein [Brucella pecoris]NKW81510.1 PaaI family thioesterase [Brucella pecoris]TNV09012.1 PaaI family thioesterase [Brucella pecoris]